ncbi:MAG: 23S rRNA (uracil(1939)-C(5))-methyltransferase RlmD [Candidatus Eremiobacteraeota bacterium]|nr:23S rRNA (uracil(1939)-C(5))-methyltransferase RlmD [Candidatus Eremiobacteraeota bacterium]
MTNSGAPKPAAAPPSSAELSIDDLLANGQGVGRLDKLVAFVTGALPGEEVRAVIEARKPNYLSAHASAILRPAPERVPSVCPVFPECGGCQVLHLEYAAQLAWKRRMLVDALQRIGGFAGVDVSPAEPSELIDGTRYRNKVSLEVGPGAPPAIGFYAARSHRVVRVEQCPVLLPRLNDAVVQFIDLAKRRPQLLDDVRHVILRTSATHDRLVLCLSTHRRPALDNALLAALREHMPALTGIAVSWSPASPNAIFGRQFQRLWGSDRLIETVCGAQFEFGLTSFFQINSAMLGTIGRELLDRLRGASRVVDLFCGVGTFAVLLGKVGMSGTGIESDGRAVDEAAANAARNQVTRCSFERAGAQEAVAGARGHTLLDGCDAVVLDPPRRGCEPQLLEALARERVPRIEYLSCNPATLARDAKILGAAGYALGVVKPYDMFPHTGHVEALAEFVLD